MTTAATFQTPETVQEAQAGYWKWFPLLIVFACINFNAALCFINTNVMGISSAHVIGSELLLVMMSVMIGFLPLNRDKAYWVIVILAQVALIAMLSIAKEGVLFKSLRDVLFMPVFIVLGLVSARLDLARGVLGLSLFVAAFGIFEAVNVDKFQEVFNIKQYFISKGAENDFTYTENNLFVSGTRGGGRFLLDVPGLHRVSSTFLEPISLGFYAIVSGIFFISLKDRLSAKFYWFAMLVTLFLIWLSDGRMALGALLVTMMLRFLFVKMDHRLSVLVFPAAFFAGVIIYFTDMLGHTGETIGARIYSTMSLLSHINTKILLGAESFPELTVDSALSDIISNQGIFGLLLYWLPPIFFRKSVSREARIYLFGMAIYLSFGFLISAAVYTIKTAALLWFQYGYLLAAYPPEKTKPSSSTPASSHI